MSPFGRYARMLRTPQMGALVAFGTLARLPFGIVSLALVLFVREQTGSFAVAGAVTAAFAVAGGLFAPLQGRLVDRIGQTRVLVPVALVEVVALATVIALGLAHAPAGVLAVAAAVAGAAIPPVAACFRPLLIELLGDDEEVLTGGYALDSIMIEVVFITGPLLTAVLVSAFSPAAALAAGAALGLAGALGFAAQPASRAWRGAGTTSGVAGALASRGMRTLVFTALPIGICFGTLEVVLPAFGVEHGAGNLSGVLFAGMAAGSAVGGLAYGAAAERLGTVVRGYLLLVTVLPASFALLLLPESMVLMLALVPIAGCVIAPLTAAENRLVSAVAPPGATTEAFTWLLMAGVVGIAAGNALAGGIVEASGWRLALLTACVAAAAGAGYSYLRRSTLRPQVAT
jgi:MFS family permease